MTGWPPRQSYAWPLDPINSLPIIQVPFDAWALLTSGRRLSGRGLAQATEIQNGIQVVYHLEYEIEGQPKPCCVTDLVFRYYG